MISDVYLMDNMELMAKYPDGYFDLALVDPPYGIGEDGRKKVRTSPSRPNSYLRKPKYESKGWDNEPPKKDYFLELIRVSKNVIIWGANHFIENIPNQNSSCWIVWDKKNEGTDFADCELAWSNMKTTVRKYTVHKFHETKGGKQCIHPTQKPVALYQWIYKNYLPNGGKVLDTHLGSGSNRIAADKMGNIDFTACEIDEDYFNAQEKRFNQYKSQLTLF